MPQTRREVCRYVLMSWTLPSLVPFGTSGCSQETEGSSSSARYARDYFSIDGSDRLTEVGRAYRESRNDTDFDDLVKTTLDMLEGAVSSIDALERLRVAHLGDLETRNMVSVQGWLLTATEADLCAIIAFA